MTVDVKFEKEGNIKRASYLITEKPLSIFLIILLLSVFSFSIISKYGFKNLPIWVWIAVIGIFLLSFLPKKVILEYDEGTGTFIRRSSKFVFGSYEKEVFTPKILKSSTYEFMKTGGKIGMFLTPTWLINTITPQQSREISKFLGIDPDLMLP